MNALILKIFGYAALVPGVLLVIYFWGIAAGMSSPFSGGAKTPDLPKTYSLLAAGLVLVAAGVALIRMST